MIKNKRNLLKILSIITIMMLSIFMLAGCGKNDENNNEESSTAYLQPLTDYFEGIKNRDIEQVIRAFPDFAGMSENLTSGDLDDLYAQYESLYGANIKIDYTFGEAVALSEEELNELENEINAAYNNSEEQTIDITAAYTVPVTVTITGDGLQEDAQNNESTEETTGEAATEETSTEGAESEDENSNSVVEESEMYAFEYNGSWYIL